MEFIEIFFFGSEDSGETVRIIALLYITGDWDNQVVNNFNFQSILSFILFSSKDL